MVTIVIPTYNRPHMLKDLLESIVDQTIKKYEVIIVDDNSTTGHDYQNLIQSYKTKIKDITYLKNKTNRGAPYSRNKGIKNAKYDLIALVDDDDTWCSTKLQRQIDRFNNADQKVGIVYTWADAVDDKGNIIHEYRSTIEGGRAAQKQILEQDFIPSPSVMLRKQALLEAGLFDEAFTSCQDWDMWTRILFKGYECRVIKSVEAIYRKHSGDAIGNSSKALLGYARFYRNHIGKALNSNPVLAIKYLYRYLKISLQGLI